MKLLTNKLRNKLISNYEKQSEEGECIDFKPVVKFFTPDAGAVWLLTELDAEGEMVFGLCDLGVGFPELGYVSLAELEALRGPLGLPVERDLYFEASKSLSEYADEARSAERIGR